MELTGCPGLKLQKSRAFEFLILHVWKRFFRGSNTWNYIYSLSTRKKNRLQQFCTKSLLTFNFLNVLKDTVGWLLSLVFVFIVKILKHIISANQFEHLRISKTRKKILFKGINEARRKSFHSFLYPASFVLAMII